MVRLLFFIFLALAVLALAGAALSALTRAAREGHSAARDLAQDTIGNTKGNGMEKVSFTALLLLMLGVTSGLLGGL
ncbi:hypothetical protein [Roseovarius sp. D0-M9]|uniref:hypothetical protein n=1 Tax=Roseovarius sp. D0-M9 TaxID=3127117 RepID=UPI0030100E97